MVFSFQEALTTPILLCPTCSFRTSAFDVYVKHVKKHQYDSNFKLSCTICTKKYKNLRSWQRHLEDFHGLRIASGCEESASASASNGDGLQATGNDEVGSRMEEDANHPTVTSASPNETDAVEPPRHKVAKLINSLRGHHLPETACSELIAEIESIAANAVEEFKNCGTLETQNLPTIASLHDMQSAYKYQKYVEEQLPYVPPETVRIGDEVEDSSDAVQYTSLLAQLKELVKLDQVKDFVLSVPENSSNGDYVDVFDGSAHSGREKDTLYISLSYDDFDVVNPLGSAASHHKLCALHFSLLNVPIEARSKVSALFMVLLCPSLLVKKHGWRKVLQPLLRDLQELLVNGISVEIDGVRRTLRGNLAFVCGDNLAIHSIAGFVECFSSAKSPCRFCLGTPDSWQTKFSEDEFVLRDQAMYDAQLRDVLDSSKDGDVVSRTGIKGESAFSELPDFKVADAFPPDIGHDVLGGVIPYVLALVLTVIVQKKYATIETLNRLIAAFPWNGVTDRPKFIRKYSGKIKIRQSASQAWTLLRYLPILLGDLVPEECKEWMVLTELCSVVELLVGWRFCRGDLVFLEHKISAWLCLLKSVFPDFRLKPKFHYMIHYVSQIRLHGPLRHCWTLRYESKYGVLKGLVKETKNFRNIAKSIAMRHQTHMAFHLNSRSLFFMGVEGFVYARDVTEMPEELYNQLQHMKVDVGRKCVVYGTMYESGQAVLVQHPVHYFGEIVAVCRNGDEVLVALILLKSLFYKHINAFEVCRSPEWTVIPLSSLACHKPCVLHTCGDRRFVVLKYSTD